MRKSRSTIQTMRTIGATFALLLISFSARPEPIDISDLVGTEWYGLYMNGQKIGFSKSSIENVGDGTVRFLEDVTFRLAMVGVKQDMKAITTRVYSLEGPLLSVDERVDDPQGTSYYSAKASAQGIELTSTVGGRTNTQTLPPLRETLQDAVRANEMMRGKPEKGTQFTYYMFEPMYGKELEAVSEVLGMEQRTFDGVPTKVYSIKTLLKPVGMESISYISESGERLEDHIGGIMTMRLEPEAVAKDVKYQNDTIVSNAAMLKAPIANPRERETLQLRIRGPLTKDHLFSDASQTFTPDGDVWLFEGRKAKAPANPPSVPITEGEAAQWTKPTLYVQSDDPALIAKAKEIVGDEKDSVKVVEKLERWVSDNMTPAFSARLSNALEVLNSLEGDCTEHSILFVGLARAAGVPAREVAGLIYADSPKPGFYFHQWAKVWVGEWMSVDPTFDQAYADATHIKLSEGDLVEQVRLLPVIGKISIEAVGN